MFDVERLDCREKVILPTGQIKFIDRWDTIANFDLLADAEAFIADMREEYPHRTYRIHTDDVPN